MSDEAIKANDSQCRAECVGALTAFRRRIKKLHRHLLVCACHGRDDHEAERDACQREEHLDAAGFEAGAGESWGLG